MNLIEKIEEEIKSFPDDRIAEIKVEHLRELLKLAKQKQGGV